MMCLNLAIIFYSVCGSIIFCKIYKAQLCANKPYIMTQNLKLINILEQYIRKSIIQNNKLNNFVTSINKLIFLFDLYM